MQVQRRTFLGKSWLASEQMRSMLCSRRCAQDATSTRDTRTVLSSAVLGVCFAGTQPVSKRLQDPRRKQVSGAVKQATEERPPVFAWYHAGVHV